MEGRKGQGKCDLGWLLELEPPEVWMSPDSWQAMASGSHCRQHHHWRYLQGAATSKLRRSGEDYRSLPNDNKISDNKIHKNSKFYCHGISQEKLRFGTMFCKFSASPTPSKTRFVLCYILVSASLRLPKSQEAIDPRLSGFRKWGLANGVSPFFV